MFAPVQYYLQDKVFWDATVCQVSSFWHLMDQIDFETSGTTPPATHWYVSKDMNPQRHCHENLKCHNRFMFIIHYEYVQRYTNCTLHPQLVCHGTSWITCHKCSIYPEVSANVLPCINYSPSTSLVKVCGQCCFKFEIITQHDFMMIKEHKIFNKYTLIIWYYCCYTMYYCTASHGFWGPPHHSYSSLGKCIVHMPLMLTLC